MGIEHKILLHNVYFGWIRAKNNLVRLRKREYAYTNINNCDNPVHWLIFNREFYFWGGGGGFFLKTVFYREMNWYISQMQEGTVGGGCGKTVPIEKMQVIRVWHREKHTGFETIEKRYWYKFRWCWKRKKAPVYGMFGYIIRNCGKTKWLVRIRIDIEWEESGKTFGTYAISAKLFTYAQKPGATLCTVRRQPFWRCICAGPDHQMEGDSF